MKTPPRRRSRGPVASGPTHCSARPWRMSSSRPSRAETSSPYARAPRKWCSTTGRRQRNFTPGAHSVVSAEGGVGDQTSGWKGREYVIEIKAQLGPDVTERYGLSADGRQLVETLHLGSGELPAVTLRRVYHSTTETAPQQLPTNE